MKATKSLVGTTVGYLQIKDLIKIDNYYHYVVDCLSCGKKDHVINKHTVNSAEKKGKMIACGCRNILPTLQTHGLSNSPEYSVYQNMLTRCYNHNRQSWNSYGGRGVRVCDRWLETNGQGFINFLNDMGKRPSKHHHLDKDVKGGVGCLLYSPENCMWALPKEHMWSRRHRNMMTDDEIQISKAMLLDGKNATQIANKLSRDPRTIQKYLNS